MALLPQINFNGSYVGVRPFASVASCDLWGPRSNVIGPSSTCYQDYTIVTDSSGIYLVSPSPDTDLTGTTLVISKASTAATYELKLATTQENLKSPIFDKADYTTNQLDPGSALNLGEYGLYNGEVLARDSSAPLVLGVSLSPSR